MSIVVPQLGPVFSIEDAQKSFTDLQVFLDQLMSALSSINEFPAAGDVTVLAFDEEGNVQQYTLVAGAGVTITRDDTAKTWTLSSP